MTYANSVPEIHYLGKFVQFISGSSGYLTSHNKKVFVSVHTEEGEDVPVPPSEDFPKQDGDGINPNREIPQEEKYLPDEEEVPVEDPAKEIKDPLLPSADTERMN